MAYIWCTDPEGTYDTPPFGTMFNGDAKATNGHAVEQQPNGYTN